MRRVDYVIWYVTSLSDAVRFYRDIVGLDIRTEGNGYVEFAMENIKLSLFERNKLPDLIGRPAGTAPCGEIGFRVRDIDAVARTLRERGVEPLTGPVDRPWGERTMHIADPDGNVIEFAQKIPRTDG
ncbi:VOC family protein [Hoyosella sp. YIM 151337]|uniref:VOC family protein n=1 Tax=Hoyosella sp. YIM 151337 TaxID=2992742 RepID=UPI0022369653|nr:VOC family protein [Hoyosella sp. YIM 151337]MCW4352927.1 VOC family protein [Hoyosella sp. YIM 151337]